MIFLTKIVGHGTRSTRFTSEDLKWLRKAERDGPKFTGKSSYVGSYRLTNSDQIRHSNPCGKGCISGRQPRPIPRGGAPAYKNFWYTSVSPYSLIYRANKFGRVT